LKTVEKPNFLWKNKGMLKPFYKEKEDSKNL